MQVGDEQRPLLLRKGCAVLCCAVRKEGWTRACVQLGGGAQQTHAEKEQSRHTWACTHGQSMQRGYSRPCPSRFAIDLKLQLTCTSSTHSPHGHSLALQDRRAGHIYMYI